eukprot:TRINITY_DN2558_c1_g1_i1.p1 TRINITY_DN2558_c1_g1~~TRINITY_DN2558_c1_g1_i1.p1  ORF type:complete len:181 (-),score=27.91 TRINITY_DN2558_c1_g1_i1:37-579(-)
MKIMFQNSSKDLHEEYLYHSVHSKNEKVLKYLLQNKINPNKIRNENSLLFTLIRNVKLFEMFLSFGADPNCFITNYIPRKFILDHSIDDGLIRQSVSLIYYGAVFRNLHSKHNFFKLINIPEMETNEIIYYLYRRNGQINLLPIDFQACFYFLIIARKKKIPKPICRIICNLCLRVEIIG